MSRKGNPISVRLDLNRSSDSSRFSDYYYGQSVYQDLNMRSFFSSIFQPTRRKPKVRLGRSIILHFPKRTFINFFLLPRPPRRLKRRKKTRPGKEKARWWTFGKVGPIRCLHPSDNTEEERNEVRDRGAGKIVESIRLDDLDKLLRISGFFKHPKYAGVVNDIVFLFLIENDDSFRKTKLFKFFLKKLKKKSRSDGPTSHLFKGTPRAVNFSLNYLVMQYLLNTKSQIHFDPVVVLDHFVAPGVDEPSTMGGANAQGRSNDKRIRSCIAFFLESSTSEKKCLGEARLTHFIRQANDQSLAGTTKTTILLFPFFGATFFFLRDGVGVYNNNNRRKRRIPYGYNSSFFDLNEMKKMRSLLSNRTKTNTLIESVKIQSPYQSASLIAQDISLKLRNKTRSFRSILNKIVKDIPFEMKKRVEGVRICCSGRLKGKEIARTECGKYGKTSLHVFNQKIDYASAEVSTPYGILGVKVWISYSKKKGGRAISETYKI